MAEMGRFDDVGTRRGGSSGGVDRKFREIATGLEAFREETLKNQRQIARMVSAIAWMVFVLVVMALVPYIIELVKHLQSM
jgi:hypothetical protein